MNDFSEALGRIIAAIPRGKVATYGQIAAMAGNPQGARQVVRFLNSSAERMGLPWHRIVNRNGCVALPPDGGFELQCQMLRDEGIPVRDDGRIMDADGPAFERFRWQG